MKNYDAKRYTEAMEYFEKAIQNGHSGAQYKGGLMTIAGEGVEKDEELGYLMIRHAAENGFPEAMFTFGFICADLGMNDEAVEWFEKADKKGNADAMEALGKIYLKGEIRAKDYEKVIYWLEKAARKGQTSAMLSLSGFYSVGDTNSKNNKYKDQKKADYWLNEAMKDKEYMDGVLDRFEQTNFGKNLKEKLEKGNR